MDLGLKPGATSSGPAAQKALPPPGNGPSGALALPGFGGASAAFNVPVGVGDGRTDVHVHVHGLDQLQKDGSEDTAEIDALRQQVKDLMSKNQELATGREKGQGNDGDEASKQASAELAACINALRRRVSCMDKKMDEAPQGRSRQTRRTTMRRASSAESLFAGLGLDGAPGSGGQRMVMDLTSLRSAEDEDTSYHDRERRSTCASMSLDLSNLRHTLKTNRSVAFDLDDDD